MHWTEDCICDGWITDAKTIEFIKISAARTELRCNRCHGLMGWLDDEPVRIRKKKICQSRESGLMKSVLLCDNS
jgi:peptide methionine sulfoxide reductase MsrB